MGKPRFSPAARQDLFDIWLHIAHDNPAAADKALDRIESACIHLRDHPRLGPARPEIAADARALVVDRWLALYRVESDGVCVVRVVDGARDLKRISFDDT